MEALIADTLLLIGATGLNVASYIPVALVIFVGLGAVTAIIMRRR